MIMLCPKCKRTRKIDVSMKEIKRKGGFHKQTKFKCPHCGLIRMKKNK